MNISDLEFKLAERPREYVQFEIAEVEDGTRFARKVGSEVVFVGTPEGEYVCLTCDSNILGATVAHPIHDGPFPLSGSGKCDYEKVLYCPSCEEKPSFDGSIITVGRKFG